MKIYQLHELGGQWEDSYDDIIGSYLKKERAEEEKAKAEQREKLLVENDRRCNNCPFLGQFAMLDVNNLFPTYPDYCTEMELEETDYGIHCENYFSHWDESYFRIEEVEVEE